MLSFQRKSLSFESALSYLQAFTRKSHAFLWNRSSLFQHFNSLCEVNGVLPHFLNAVLSEKITFLWKCLELLTSIQQKLTCVSLKEKSMKTFQFSVRSDWSVELLCKILISEKSLCFVSALRFYEEYNRNPHAFLLKKSSLFKHFNWLCKVFGVLHYIVNAVVSEKITFLWKCLKLLTSIHRKLKCVSMKEKLSVPTLQFTVRSEWSVASLSKCCPFRENHFPLKVP